MANIIPNSMKYDVAGGRIDLDTDTFGIILVTSAYTMNPDTHSKRSDVTNEVANGGGYTTGGKTLTGVTLTQNNTNDRADWDANDPSWPTSTITARGAVIFKSRGGAASADELVVYLDFGSDIVSTNGTFSVAFDPVAILSLA